MRNNLEKIMEREGKLEELDRRADILAEGAQQFQVDFIIKSQTGAGNL